jgi:hypothetical protein
MKDAIINIIVSNIGILEDALRDAPTDHTDRQDVLEITLRDILDDIPDDIDA